MKLYLVRYVVDRKAFGIIWCQNVAELKKRAGKEVADVEYWEVKRTTSTTPNTGRASCPWGDHDDAT
jgi:hypothetical protein